MSAQHTPGPFVVFVVIDARGDLLGVYASEKAAQAVADAHAYFCRVVPQEVKA